MIVRRQASLGEIFEIARGGSPRPIQDYLTDDPAGVNWISIADASASDKYIFTTKKRIRKEGVSGSRMVKPGDFLLTNSMSFGRPYILKTSGCIHDGWLVLSSKKDDVDQDFFFHLLGSDAVYSKFSQLAAGVTVKNLNIDLVAGVQVDFPSLAEQRRVAAILDQAANLRSQRRAALALLDSLTQSIFLDMFGDPVMNPKGWTLSRLGKMGSLDRGVSKHRPRNAPQLLGGPYPLIQTGEVANCGGYIRSHNTTYSEIGLRQSKLWPAGTLCITIAANIAKTGILTFDACFPDSVVGFRADDSATVEFVRVWLSFLQKALEESAPESAQKNINLALLRDLPIPVPPLSLQQAFAVRIQAIEFLKAAHRAALAEFDALFASLQHRAFNGELTAREVPVATPSRSKVEMFEGLRKLDSEIGLEALIYVAKRTPKHDFYKALKSLYFADKHHLEHNGRLIYGETHCALPKGPVPQAAFDAAKVLSGEMLVCAFPMDALHGALRRTDKQLIPLRDADFGKLGSAERESLDWAIRYCAPMSFDQVKTASHDSAYERTPANAPIALEDMIRMLPEAAQRRFSVLAPP